MSTGHCGLDADVHQQSGYCSLLHKMGQLEKDLEDPENRAEAAARPPGQAMVARKMSMACE